MRKWLFLAGAIAGEVTGSLSLKAALDHPGWYALVAAGYLASFAFLTAVLRAGVPLGAAYGIWAASGVALTAIASKFLFKEPLTRLMGLGIGCIAAGVLLVEFGAGH
ncbi:DMT family transporter [Saccharothrix deserti]|uniref:DMT family transporter n=1 Tax=Saccharothrix deserti TaxID=2593674 RepID=UPI00131E6332|nr:SMR family transporter [Saccharothrix deserti]